MTVSQLFVQGERRWDVMKVMQIFSRENADSILATRIPEYLNEDRLAWIKTTNGKYSIKTGYQLWHDRNVGVGSVLQSKGWSRLWKLDVPHKVKIFLWRFCRNNIPVKSRLSTKGVQLPLNCPMCDADIEDTLHVFFECPFASACWSFAGKSYALSSSEDVATWLLTKLDTGLTDDIMLIVKVLWGVWFFRNQKVWENKVVNAAVAMGWSAKTISEWREAKGKRALPVVNNLSTRTPVFVKWVKPVIGSLKLNVDAAVKLGESTFQMGLVLRDHAGTLVLGKTVCKTMVSSVFEAEALAVLEGLQWLLTLQHDIVVIESDSLLTVRALHCPEENVLEVGNVLEACRNILNLRPGFSISFVKRQANKVAHLVAKLPCSLNCQNVFTSPSNLLLESLLYDISY